MAGWENELIVFGGRYQTDEWWYSNETWSYDLETDRWALIETESMPSPRYTSGVATMADELYLFGGMESRYEPVDTDMIRRINRFLTSLPVRNSVFPTLKPNVFLQDVWRFDRNKRSWKVVAHDIGIPPLKTPLMGFYEDSLIVGFGKYREHSNTVWRLHNCF
jgi:N-acetylneuraminic acid mutarotase